MDTGTIEAGKAILKFYKRVRGNQEAIGIKRGKSMGNRMKEHSSSFYKKNT